MKALHLTISGGLAAIAVVLAVGIAAPAWAQRSAKAEAKVPDSFPYEIRNGRRVPKGNRTVNADGSWREENKEGPCVTVREKTASGEYRETRKCE